jgi:hypothetical protein
VSAGRPSAGHHSAGRRTQHRGSQDRPDGACPYPGGHGNVRGGHHEPARDRATAILRGRGACPEAARPGSHPAWAAPTGPRSGTRTTRSRHRPRSHHRSDPTHSRNRRAREPMDPRQPGQPRPLHAGLTLARAPTGRRTGQRPASRRPARTVRHRCPVARLRRGRRVQTARLAVPAAILKS